MTCTTCNGTGRVPVKARYVSTHYSPKTKDKEPIPQEFEIQTAEITCPTCYGRCEIPDKK